MNRVYLCLLPILLALVGHSFAQEDDEDCFIAIRNVTIINFPVDTSVSFVEILENHNVFFQSFGAREEDRERIYDVSPDNDTSLSNSEFKEEFSLDIVVDGSGKYLIPSLIDSNVHFFNIEDIENTQAGLSAFIDLGSDYDFLDEELPRFSSFRAGLKITSSDIIASGAEGVVVQVQDDEDVEDQIQEHEDMGATLISLTYPLDSDVLEEIVDEVADSESLAGVSITALFEEDAMEAASVSTSNLDHYTLSVTPLDTMSNETLSAWATADNRAIISTLSVYQGSRNVDNLMSFIALGGTVLYGSDNGAHLFFGPSNISGIDIVELRLLERAFGTIEEAYRAATIEPAMFWGFDRLARIEVDAIPSFILTPENPLDDFINLEANGTIVFLAGEQVNCTDSTCNACDAPIENETADDDTVEIVVSVVVPLFFLLLLLVMVVAGLLWHYFERKPKRKRRARREFQMELDADDFDLPLLDSDNDFLEPGDEDDEYSEDSGV